MPWRRQARRHSCTTAADRLAIGSGPVSRTQHDRGPGLRVLESRLGRSAECHLGGIHEVEDEDLVAAVPEEAKRLERQVAVEEQIGDEDHEAAAAELLHDPPERRLGGGALPRLERAEGTAGAAASGSGGRAAAARSARRRRR